MLGGETAMWGEGSESLVSALAGRIPQLPPPVTVNEDNFDEYVWRGAGAAAERLWSPYALTPSHAAATDRFVEHLCRLSLMGVRAGPIEPSYCPADTMPKPNATLATAVVGAIDSALSRGASASGRRLMVELTEEQALLVRARLQHA